MKKLEIDLLSQVIPAQTASNLAATITNPGCDLSGLTQKRLATIM
jgi:hypothetical protein